MVKIRVEDSFLLLAMTKENVDLLLVQKQSRYNNRL